MTFANDRRMEMLPVLMARHPLHFRRLVYLHVRREGTPEQGHARHFPYHRLFTMLRSPRSCLQYRCSVWVPPLFTPAGTVRSWRHPRWLSFHSSGQDPEDLGGHLSTLRDARSSPRYSTHPDKDGATGNSYRASLFGDLGLWTLPGPQE